MKSFGALFARRGSSDKGEDLTRPRVPSQLGFLEHRRVVDGHLESPAPRRHQFNVGIRDLLANGGRQTDGTGFVVSNDAEFDLDAHGSGHGSG